MNSTSIVGLQASRGIIAAMDFCSCKKEGAIEEGRVPRSMKVAEQSVEGGRGERERIEVTQEREEGGDMGIWVVMVVM